MKNEPMKHCLYPAVTQEQAEDGDYAFARNLKYNLFLQIMRDRGICAYLAQDGDEIAGMITFFPKDLVPELGRVLSSKDACPP